MRTATPCSSDDPMLIAWKEFEASDRFPVCVKWARIEKHTEGALWEAFCRGYQSAIAARNAPDVAPVAWLHIVTQGDGETDQALSFSPDSFPFDKSCGYKSLEAIPLYSDGDRFFTAEPEVTP